MRGITILMPCLNEERTLGMCIERALMALKKFDLPGEIIIADNGSKDNSVSIAESMAVKVVHIEEKGYGAAIGGGIQAASFDYIIMGDADASYDFSDLAGFIDKLEEGYDLVMGNRFMGGIEPGAMPFSHRYIGNPLLSGIGKLFYRTKIGDFHCGLRAFRRDSILKLNLCTTGMEFASEMVVKATIFRFRITEIPCKLYPDGRDRPPHLRSIPDGFRHLKFLLIYSPKWLFFYPGIVFTMLGIVLMIILFLNPITVLGISFESITMFYSAIMTMLGYQLVQFSLYTNIFGRRIGQFPATSKIILRIEKLMYGRGFVGALLLILAGIIGIIFSVILWSDAEFGPLIGTNVQRLSVLFGTLFVLGVQSLFSCFFVNVLHMGEKNA